MTVEQLVDPAERFDTDKHGTVSASELGDVVTAFDQS
jgi:Ca2+-binding EF-hand superfamily protein